MTAWTDDTRFARMPHQRCGRSGLMLSRIGLGLWHNFGGVDAYEDARSTMRSALDHGITHIDLANNYGPPPGSAEETFGRLLRDDLHGMRDDLVITSKAGYRMQPGPFGDGGGRKYLIQSCEASLRRMGLDYVDIFYHHRPDPDTPMEETAGALHSLVQSGKALYVGISNYDPDQTRHMHALLSDLGTPLLIHQFRYNASDRRPEAELLPTLTELGIGGTAFSPLDQGKLTGRYIDGIPDDSRAGRGGFLRPEHITDDVVTTAKRILDDIAGPRGWSVAQVALAWILRRTEVTSVLIGASRPLQVEEAAAIAHAEPLSSEEIDRLEAIVAP